MESTSSAHDAEEEVQDKKSWSDWNWKSWPYETSEETWNDKFWDNWWSTKDYERRNTSW